MLFKQPLLTILLLLLLAGAGCTYTAPQPGNTAAKPKGTAVSTSQNKSANNTRKKSKRELRYLRFANGGIAGYFDDGTVTGCPRCDFCRSNIIAMFDDEPYGTYTVEPDGSLLVDGHDREMPEYHEGDPDGWALIDYKWYIKPPQE